MDLAEKQSIFAQNLAKLITYIHACNFACSVGEVFRTAEQAALNAKNGTGIVDSLHCKRLAVDLNLFSPGEREYLTDTTDYERFGAYWEMLHPSNQWGGRFKKRPDGNHFEMKE